MVDDPERDRLAGRVARFARVGAGLSGAAATFGANALFANGDTSARNAKALRDTLGKLKGPLMKVAQLLATVPDLLPPEFAAELAELQTNAPAMGPAFVRRRMAAEHGPDWQSRFADFDQAPAAAASLVQVHRANPHDGRRLAVKLQYPEMQSAVESDLGQLRVMLRKPGRRADCSQPSTPVRLPTKSARASARSWTTTAKRARCGCTGISSPAATISGSRLPMPISPRRGY